LLEIDFRLPAENAFRFGDVGLAHLRIVFTKAKSILGWEPKVDLEQGLAKTIEYFRPRVK